MLTRLEIRNFKRFDEAVIELGEPVVLVGPNNCGKTTALQALALWDVGLRAWTAKRDGKDRPKKRPGVAINRRDLSSIPIPQANMLWHDLHVRDVTKNGGKQRTKNVRIDIVVSGITESQEWTCGLEFDYSNAESFFCRPVRLPGHGDSKIKDATLSEIPESASKVRVAYLPPMSGLTDREFLKQEGEIGFLIGQGQTAQVLRNICYRVANRDDGEQAWNSIAESIERLFGTSLLLPVYVAERSEIIMEYKERGVRLDLASAGRGMQQTLLLLAYLQENAGTVLLLDEPDAHLEVLRQRQIYQLITETAAELGSQVIAASHSEVVLNEAAGTGKVIAFVGQPHVLNDGQTHQLRKSLTDIGWDQYSQAEQTGWLLCLEGPTDLAILRAFARTLEHPAGEHLERPFVHYVATNRPQKARDLFYGLREAKDDLRGIAIFDRLERPSDTSGVLVEVQWSRRELENFLCREEVLLRFAHGPTTGDLFAHAEAQQRESAMQESVQELTQALETLGKPSPWSPDIKATDDFLDPLLKSYYKRLDLPLGLRKSDYHILASLVSPDDIDDEITVVLARIVEVAEASNAPVE